MKKLLTNIFVIIIGLFFVTSGFGQEKTGQMAKNAGKQSTEGERINAFMAEKIIGSKVQNMEGEDLGVIKDVVIDIDTGRVLYAILDFGGFLGIGGKLFPVPWHSLAPLPSEGIFFLDASKAKLERAPGYTTDNLPDMGDIHWGTQIAQFYKAPRGAREEEGYGYDYYGYGYGYGPEMYPGLAQKDPFAKVFDPKSIKTISGEVIKVDAVVPKSGLMSQMETKLIVYMGRKEVIPVYVGPEWYITGSAHRRPFKSGDKVTVTGSWITSEGATPFLIATSATHGKETLQLRDKDGTPIWVGWKKMLPVGGS